MIEAGDGTIAFAHPLGRSTAQPPGAGGVRHRRIARPAGCGWAPTRGLVRFDTRNERYRSYGLADGLQDLEFNGGAVAHLSDGRLVFGGVRGFNLFDPRQLRRFQLHCRRCACCRRGSARTRRATAARCGSRRNCDCPTAPDLLRLRIGALDYAPSADIHYRYRLDGFDLGWIDNGRQQDITYTRLPPGDYTFRAQATNRDGVWNPQELSLPVRVVPPWWRHPLVMASGVLALLALIGAPGLAAAPAAPARARLLRRRSANARNA